jgi:transposase-like protein
MGILIQSCYEQTCLVLPWFKVCARNYQTLRVRDKNAAARFFKRLPRQMKYKPRVVVTDKRVSYTEPCAKLLPNAVHRHDKGLNNRADAKLVQRLLAQRR